MDKTRAVDGFYDDEAARLATNAARVAQSTGRPAQTTVQRGSYVPPIMLGEPQRAPLRPERPINQNLELTAEPRRRFSVADDEQNEDHPAFTIARMTAWILLAPWYLAALAGSLGLLVLFGKDLFGL